MPCLAQQAAVATVGGVLVALLAGCASEPVRQAAIHMYEISPEQCATIQARYMTALVSLEPEDDELDRLTCQMNKCAAMEELRAGLDGRDGYDVGEQTRFAYAPEALGGQPCR